MSPYGSDKQQRFDVYGPLEAKEAPIIFMVHGGACSLGNKAQGAVVENKVARWVPGGFIVISTNYRLLLTVGPIEQAKDVARALAVAQDKAASWGGDRTKFILMGHSAGAHLGSPPGDSAIDFFRYHFNPLVGHHLSGLSCA